MKKMEKDYAELRKKEQEEMVELRVSFSYIVSCRDYLLILLFNPNFRNIFILHFNGRKHLLRLLILDD